MRHISEVLRLAAQGLSQREISTSVGISRTSVRNIWRAPVTLV
jgi:DNA-binding CsgD family transcriptional regulator